MFYKKSVEGRNPSTQEVYKRTLKRGQRRERENQKM